MPETSRTKARPHREHSRRLVSSSSSLSHRLHAVAALPAAIAAPAHFTKQIIPQLIGSMIYILRVAPGASP